MTNREIAQAFQLLASMMDLHGDNTFRVRSYRNAYNALKRIDRPLGEMKREELEELPGIGKAISSKIREMVETGRMQRLEEYRHKTPEGVQEMLMIKGLGAGRVRSIWKEMHITSPVELLYACEENRLVELPGFGLRTQHDIEQKIRYYLESLDKHIYASVEPVAGELISALSDACPGKKVQWVGEFARKCPVIHTIALLVEDTADLSNLPEDGPFALQSENGREVITYQESLVIQVYFAPRDQFVKRGFELTGTREFVNDVLSRLNETPGLHSEEELFDKAGLPFIIPEMREDASVFDRKIHDPAEYVAPGDLKGILHCHSTYSDGLHTVRQMAEYVQQSGYGYFGLSDHSQSAVYAGGLTPEEVQRQFDEIDKLNVELAPFRIFKGIESDILNDGSLDYKEELLQQFDFIVASVHSNLQMDAEKANKRLIAAIENSYTDILGHPSGRLLLSRKGYPLDHEKIIDACAANGVAIELNANPLRLDIDYTWLPYAQDRGVYIAINPDAHSRESIHNVRFGVHAARKGGLIKDHCLNCMDATAFAEWLALRRK